MRECMHVHVHARATHTCRYRHGCIPKRRTAVAQRRDIWTLKKITHDFLKVLFLKSIHSSSLYNYSLESTLCLQLLHFAHDGNIIAHSCWHLTTSEAEHAAGIYWLFAFFPPFVRQMLIYFGHFYVFFSGSFNCKFSGPLWTLEVNSTSFKHHTQEVLYKYEYQLV